MTASLHRLGAGREAGLYYTNDRVREARPSARDEYYLAEGGGIWWSTGQSVVRHGARIEAASFRDLCAGIDPGSGRPLVRGAGEGHWAGLDCTMTTAKSVSVLWAAGDAEQRAAIEAAQDAAVERALRFVAEEGLVVVRTGAGGRDKHLPSDLIVARFAHFTTREGDPNLHQHCILLNVAGAPAGARSGRYGSLSHLTTDPERAFAWQRAIGAAFRAALADELRTRFGFQFRPAGQGQWEIAGIPQTVLAAFSKRSAQIEARVGPDATPAQREIAVLATRQGKGEVPTGPELEARWRREIANLDVDVWAAARDARRTVEPKQAPVCERDPPAPVGDRDAGRDLPFDSPEVVGGGPIATAASALLRHESVITRKDLLQRGLEEAGLRGIGVAAVEAELAALEQDGTLIGLAQDPLARGATAAWSTPGIAACEAALLRSANRLDERDWLNPEAVELALTEAPHLSAEQVEAVRHAANRDGVGLIEAGAGTGKTTAAQAIVRSAHLSGIQVIGLAPSWQAADELSASARISAQAIARWRFDRAHGQGAPVDDRSLILVDEAGMVGTRDMEAILSAAQATGAKVMLVGDRRQLASVAGASALRAVAEVVERSAAMEAVRRQAVDWQRAASVLMARGDSESALRAYAVREQVELVSGLEAARARAVEVWTEQRAAYGDDVLIVTRRNRDAAALNRMAREVLRAEGRLGPDLATLPTIDREGKAAALPLAVGDRLRFGETLPHLSIRNGNRATVTAIKLVETGAAIVRLRLDDGREIEEQWKRLAREPLFSRRPGPPRITHAVAGTAYAAQGRTASAATLAIFSSTDAREIYVGLTRHRYAVRIVVERERLDALCRQRQADPRDLPTATAILERLYKEARQYNEKANVADYAEDRVAFAETGRLRGSPNQDRLGVERALRGAHRLRAALTQLYPQRIIVPIRRIIADRDHWKLQGERAGLATLAIRMRAILHRPLQVRRIEQEIGRDR